MKKIEKTKYSKCDEGLIKPKHLSVDFNIVNKVVTFGILYFFCFFSYCIYFHNFLVQSAGGVEYTDCISA